MAVRMSNQHHRHKVINNTPSPQNEFQQQQQLKDPHFTVISLIQLHQNVVFLSLRTTDTLHHKLWVARLVVCQGGVCVTVAGTSCLGVLNLNLCGIWPY